MATVAPKSTKAKGTSTASAKPAANVSRKRKVRNAEEKEDEDKEEEGEDEENLSEGPAIKKRRGAPKKEAANVSKKRKGDDSDESAGEEAKPPVKKARVDSKKVAAKPKAVVPSEADVKPKVTTKPKVVINHAPEKRMNIYVMGEGSAGELGLGFAKGVTDVKRPRLNPLLSAETVGVVQIATGGMHAVALTHDNRILTWGVNDQGALGRDTKGGERLKDADAEDSDSDAESDSGLNHLESTPTAISSDHFPEGTVFVQVAAGDSVTVALTDEGLVYGWGTFRVSELPKLFSSNLADLYDLAEQRRCLGVFRHQSCAIHPCPDPRAKEDYEPSLWRQPRPRSRPERGRLRLGFWPAEPARSSCR